jgi:FkbM family methyltransferase
MIISYAQNFEDVMLWRALRQVAKGFYIDVGANDPSVDSVTKLFYQNGWRGINIEPIATHYLALQNERPLDINLRCAVGSSHGQVEIWACDVRGWATLEPSVIDAHIANGIEGQYSTVLMTTLTAVCEQYAPPQIHYLKIDVEGFERSVLEGLDFERFRPWIVVVEATRPHSTVEVHESWEPLLLNANYSFVYADGLNRFYLAREQAELSGAFKYPPNFFDGFVRAPEMEGNIWAQTIVDRAAEAETHAADAQARALQAEARTTEAQTRTADAQARALQAEACALHAETLRLQAESLAADAQAHALQVEARASRAEALTLQAEARALHAEALTLQAEARSADAEAHSTDAQARALQAEARATHAEALTLQAEALGADAEARNLDREARISALLSSTSWRITRPLRWSMDLVHRFRQFPAAKSHLRQDIESDPDPVPEQAPTLVSQRLKLAIVSPLPPERSGIADYSAVLIPALAHYYDIDVIVDQAEISAPWISANCGVRSAEWVLQNPGYYDRILYHFGNSSYHQHMFRLLAQLSGVVVLHDFYLGDVLNYLEAHRIDPIAFCRALYTSHGYGALSERLNVEKLGELLEKYPVNLEILQEARGVIVHSQHSRQLANSWYGPGFSDDWSVIPLMRTPNLISRCSLARDDLALRPDDFLVCSFGLMGAAKLNFELLRAWLQSQLAHDERCILVFVGEENGGEYGAQIRQAIEASGLSSRIRISGWADPVTFTNYLDAADIAVQLRARSRGETSAAVMDCLNHSLPTIINAHGAFAELPSDAVWMLPEHFETVQLTEALESLWQDAEKRSRLGQRGRELVVNRHAPDVCAQEYASAIEQAYVSTQTPVVRAAKQLLVDVSATCRNDLKTGIQRVVRAIVWELIKTPPAGYRVEPVYLTDEEGVWDYRYARDWTSGALGVAGGWMPDDSVKYSSGDVLLIADYTSGYAVEAERAGVFKVLKKNGVQINFLAYDLLPVQMPECFPPGQFGFSAWLTALTRVADGAICISQAVAQDLRAWIEISGPPRLHSMSVDWFHLGADIASSIPSVGVTDDFANTLSTLKQAPSFLMVGTIEPRKGYMQTIKAFTHLWKEGFDVNLVIVGSEGWRGLADDLRRTIPDILSTLRAHPEFGKRLLWLDGVSDECLELVYASCSCLIAASEGEGFGLPLIEAAQHNLPIIARDLRVFKEVAEANAFYFSGLRPAQLAEAIACWLALKKENEIPQSSSMQWQTWAQSVQCLVQKLDLPQPLQ